MLYDTKYKYIAIFQREGGGGGLKKVENVYKSPAL